MADSKNKEAAYLFSQWATSPSISLQRVQLPYTLRDAYRISHYAQAVQVTLALGEQYLKALNDAANNAVLDPIMTGAADLRQRAGIADDGDVRRQGHPVGTERHRRGMDTITRTMESQKAEGVVRSVPEAARRDQPEHGREEGPGGQDLGLTP